MTINVNFAAQEYDLSLVQFQIRPNGTKSFSKDGVCFGWVTIIEMWERDLKRTSSGKLSSLPGMQQRYITRDSWTKLNVKPAKIMQVYILQ